MERTVLVRERKQRGGPLPAALLAAGLLLSSLLMWQASNAAFTATTSNSPNSFSTGTVILASSPGSALFTVTGLKPGDTGSACITVTYSGTLTAPVRMYATLGTNTNSLADHITLQIHQSTGNSTITAPSCTSFSVGTSIHNGTMQAFATSYPNYASGATAWTPTAAASRDYRIIYTLSSGAPNTTQGSTATMTFTWEAQNS